MIDASSRVIAAPGGRRASRLARLGGAALAVLAILCASCGGSRAEERQGMGSGADAAEDAPAIGGLPPFQERPITAAPRPSIEPRPRGAAPDEPGADPPAAALSAGPAAAPGPATLAAATGPGDASRGTGVDIDGEALTLEVSKAVQRALARAREARSGRYDAGATTVAVSVVDLRTRRRLVDRLGGARLRPASNMKVLTAAAALLGLGADFAFETPFHAVGAIEGGALRGDLVAEAGGDPLHAREGDGSLDRWLDPLAASLRAAGVERVTGALVLDEGTYAPPAPGPEWPDQSQWWTDYCALSGGFSAGGGNFRATVRPGRDGGPADVVLRPRDHGLEARIGVRTGPKNDLRVGATASTVTVRGTVPASGGVQVEEFRHPDPVDLFGHVVVEGLRRRGIPVEGGFRRDRGAAPEPGYRISRGTSRGTARGPKRGTARGVARGSAPVHVMRSPLASVLEAILLDSNNPVADQVFLAMGDRLAGAGTREGGARAVRQILTEAGVSIDDLVQIGGSGLSKANRATTRTFVEALSALAARDGDLTPSEREARAVFFDSLPSAGTSGSLARRMGGTAAEGRVRAKTGWVAGASGLSGYVLDRDGDPALAFSILVEYPRVGGLNNAAWKPMQDEMCAAFTEALDAAERIR